MTVHQQGLPTTSTITEVPNADGTVTRTIVNQYKDGTRRTLKEILPAEATDANPPMVQALPANPAPSAPSLYDIEGNPTAHASVLPPTPTASLVADAQQPTSPSPVSTTRLKNAPPVPNNILSKISIAFVVLGTAFGIAAGMYTHLSQEDSNDDLEEDMENGQLAGAAAIFLFTLATPFMFFSGKLYRVKRSSKGLPAFGMTAWIIYGFALAYAGGLLFLGVEVQEYIRPMWVYVAVVFNLVPFLLMMIHAEAARTR